MKSIKFNLPESVHKVEIHTFADLHIGDCSCNMKAIKERIQAVKDNPNAYIILNGDIMNNATKTSISDCYAEEIPPMEQLNRFVELFDGLQDRIIGACSGNHEDRTYNKEGIDLTYLAMKQLGIADRYAKEGFVALIRFGKNGKNQRPMIYSVYATHGSGGGRRPGAKINRLEDMLGTVSTDVYIHSHTHCPIVFKSVSFGVNLMNGAVYEMPHLFVNTSAMLDYGGYGQAKEYHPAAQDCPVVYLYEGRTKRMEAKI